MSDLGNLSQCIVDSDSREVGRARRLRGRAVIASLFLETAVIAGMLLWPLMTPAVLSPQPILAPVPIFHSAPRSSPEPARQVEHPAPRRPNSTLAVLLQPPSIPPHIVASPDAEPPIAYETVGPAMPGGPGTGIGGDASEPTPTARPESNPRPSRPIPISGGVMNALLIHRVQPDYPLAARMMRLAGTVQLRAIIGTDGTVQNIEVVSGHPILVKAAIEAVQQWRYQPTRLSGKPVEVETVITVQFQME